MRHTLLAMVMILICLDVSVAQASSDNARASLRGLSGVEVVVEGIGQDARADGLSRDEIRTAVEHVLRSNRIKILTTKESNKTLTSPSLYVRVSTYKNKAGIYAFSITVELDQFVSLLHLSQHEYVTTYKTAGLIGTTAPSRMGDLIDFVESEVKSFSNDFLAVNPK